MKKKNNKCIIVNKNQIILLNYYLKLQKLKLFFIKIYYMI